MNKQIIGLDTGTVVFTPGAAGAGTIVISAMTGFSVSRVLAITNVTRKMLLYVPEGGTGVAGAWTSVTSAGGTLTLDVDTTSHNAADVVRVLYGISTSGQGYNATATVTRGANQTPYTANDVVGGALTIANVGPSSGKILITAIDMIQNISAVPAAQTSFRLYFYDVTPPSAIADNSPFTFGSGDRASFLGYVDLGSPALLGTGTGTPQAQVSQINWQIALNGSTSVFAYLVTAGGFTPAANSETYSIRVKAIAI